MRRQFIPVGSIKLRVNMARNVLTPTASRPAHDLPRVLVVHEPLEALPPRQLLRLLGELELRDRRLLAGAGVVGRVVCHVAVLLVGRSLSHLARTLLIDR